MKRRLIDGVLRFTWNAPGVFWVVVRCGVGGAALRDVATTLVWSGAWGESVGAWFGAHLCGHRTGRRADGDVTDRRFVPARSHRGRVSC
jgi:hypothetical protein